MNEEVLSGIKGYGGSSCDGAIPIPDDIDNVI